MNNKLTSTDGNKNERRRGKNNASNASALTHMYCIPEAALSLISKGVQHFSEQNFYGAIN